jgi:hypothetical protein
MANPVIKKFIQKQLFKQKGAISSGKAVDFSTNALETRLTNAGIDLNLIKSQKDLDQALAFVKQIEDQVFAKKFGETFGKKESAEVFDLKGKKLDPNEPIMGGTQEESIKKNIAAATEKGDFKGIANQVLRDPNIAREFAMMKKFPFKKAEGEEAIPLAMKAKFDDEMGIKSIPDRDYSVEKLVSDFKKFGNASDKDIQMILKSGKSGQIPYVMDNYGMSYSDVINTLKRGDDLIKGLATGGRAGFKVGSPSKRLFLKTAGGLAALITAIKSGLIGVPKKEVAKQVIKESAKDVGSAPPDYFFNLANKIKNLGKESKVKPQERVNEYNYKGKDGSDYTLTEDITTGDMQIIKEKGGVGFADDKAFDTINDRTVMEYKAPKQDFDPDTETILKDGPEYDEYRVNFDQDGTPADADEISEIIKKEIIEEASEMPQKKIKIDLSEKNLKESIDKFKKIDETIDTVDQNINKKIKRASGGVAYMLGE